MLACPVLWGATATAQPLEPLAVQNGRLATPTGDEVVLRAINLGNWLLIEPWMLGLNTGDIPDQATFFGILDDRFGPAEAERLMDIYRAGYITSRDMQTVADLGFNAVRLPFDHALIEDESDAFRLRDDAFEWLDRAVELAEDAGLYVILDLHGAPGGQSLDQPSGDRTENNLWFNNEAQERLAWIWQHIARRYKNRAAVAAYDMLNEPYGDFSTDYTGELVSIAQRTHDAVRLIDPDVPIFLPGALNRGIAFYGDPATRGWSGIGFTEHTYPGVFGGAPPSLALHAREIQGWLTQRAAYSASVGAPFFLGEFNPVFDRAGNPEVTRAYMDRAEDLGVSTAWWSYKIVKPDGGLRPNNWELVTNAASFSLGNPRTASKAQIEAAFASFATMPLALDSGTAAAMTASGPADPLPGVGAPVGAPPADAGVAGLEWFVIGDAPASPAVVANGSRDRLYTSGRDIFGNSDAFTMLGEERSGNVFVSTVIDRFEAGAEFAKAGVMIRDSAAANSSHAYLHVFTDGRVVLATRSSAGNGTGQQVVGRAAFPAGLAIARLNGVLRAWYTDIDGVWQTVIINQSVSMGGSMHAGLAASAGAPDVYSVVTVDELTIAGAVSLPAAPAVPTGPDLMINGDFESASNPSVPDGWQLEGGNIGRETGWTPLRNGTALLAYRHWQVSGGTWSSAARAIGGLTPGEPHEVVLHVNRDSVSFGSVQARTLRVEIETFGGALRVMEARDFPISEIATGSEWSRLVVPFRPTASAVRVKLSFEPAPSGNRDGAVKVDEIRVLARPGPGDGWED